MTELNLAPPPKRERRRPVWIAWCSSFASPWPLPRRTTQLASHSKHITGLESRPIHAHSLRCCARQQGSRGADSTSLSIRVAAIAALGSLSLALCPGIPCDAAPETGRAVLSTNTLARRYLITDSAALLRYALPVDETLDPPVRVAQTLLERVGVDLRSSGPVGSQGLRRDISALETVLKDQSLDMLLQVPAKHRLEASALIAELRNGVTRLESELGLEYVGRGAPSSISDRLESIASVVKDVSVPKRLGRQNFDVARAEEIRGDALDAVGRLEELMVQDSGLAFRIPRRYRDLPRLEGRAVVEFEIQREREQNAPVTVRMTLDGYSAPLNAGNFLDLVRKGIYDGATIQNSQRGFYLQFSNPEGVYVDEATGQPRTLPMEVLVSGERVPVYGMTLDQAGAGDLQPVLPVTAFGAVASTHSIENPNDASSQFYVFLFDPKSYQARSMGGNALNGSLSCFGYVTGGQEQLSALERGDKVVAARVVSGLQYLRLDADSDIGVLPVSDKKE